MVVLNLVNLFQESNEPRGLVFASAFKLIVGDKLGYLPQHPASMVANNTYPTVVGVTKDAGAFIMTRFYDQLADLRSRNISDYINIILKHTAQPRHYQLWKNWAMTHIFTPEDVRNPTIQGLVQKLLEVCYQILSQPMNFKKYFLVSVGQFDFISRPSIGQHTLHFKKFLNLYVLFRLSW